MSEERSNQLFDDLKTAAVSAPKALEQYFLVLLRAVLGIFTAPATMVLRRDFGTQAIHPITLGVTWLAFQTATIVSIFIPGSGIVDVWVFYMGFIILMIVHAARLRPIMRDMSRENDGEDEGSPWFFFRLLPHATEPMVRCVYEPLTLLALGSILAIAHVLTPAAGILVMVVASALFVRTVLRYYEIWVYLRDMRNNAYRAKVMQMLIAGELPRAQAEAMVFTAGPGMNAPSNGSTRAASALVQPQLDPEFVKMKVQ